MTTNEHDGETELDSEAVDSEASELESGERDVTEPEMAESDTVEASDAEPVDSEPVDSEMPESDIAEASDAEDDSTVELGQPSEAATIEAKRAIEAIVLVASDPIPTQLLAQLIEVPLDAVAHLCAELASEYREQRRGFQLAEVAGGWRFQTHPTLAAYVERFALEGQSARLSAAALETLAIVAYKQPISRGQVSAIRGVNVDGVLRTLEQRGYIAEHARDSGPGQAILFGTTDLFLDKLGLADLNDLPPLGEFVPAASVVEALEQTLRAEAEEADAAIADDVVIDLTDDAPAAPLDDPADEPDDVADTAESAEPVDIAGPAESDPAPS